MEGSTRPASLFRAAARRPIRLLSVATPVDLFGIGFGLLLLVFALSFSIKDTQFVYVNVLLIILFTGVVVGVRARFHRSWSEVIHMFYIGLLIPLLFKTSSYLTHIFHNHDFDQILIVADRLLTGVQAPTIWLYQNFPHPAGLTEYLQICYSIFYLLPAAVGADIYLRYRAAPFGEKMLLMRQLEEVRFVTLYGFAVSYIGYMMLPAVGPRFTLHDFWSISRELPGLYFTEPLRQITNAGENIRETYTAVKAQSVVIRDAFPSGHAMMTMVTMLLAFKFRVRIRWVIFLLGASLIFSTVYLRYHYVIDVVAGGLFGVIVLYTWAPVYRGLQILRLRILATPHS